MTSISPSPVGLMDGLNYVFIYFCINVFCALIFYLIAIVQESKGEYDGYISSSPVGLMERLYYIFVLLVVVSFYLSLFKSRRESMLVICPSWLD